MATDFSDRSARAKKPPTASARGTRPSTQDVVREFVNEAAAELIHEKVSRKIAHKADSVAAKASRHFDRFERLADHLDIVDVWTRSSVAARQSKMSRDDIAAAAIRIADEEGLAALSMRRLGAELDVGTMSLYHYVRTKDELLTLVMDSVMGEVLVPPSSGIPADWRAAVTLIARRTKAALERHPWIVDITDDPPIGPNAMRHFDQTQEAVSSFGSSPEERFDLMMAIDEYVFGYFLHARNNLGDDEADSETVRAYMAQLFDRGDYPTLNSMVAEFGFDELWDRIHAQFRDNRRFERNLARILDGFESSQKSATGPVDATTRVARKPVKAVKAVRAVKNR